MLLQIYDRPPRNMNTPIARSSRETTQSPNPFGPDTEIMSKTNNENKPPKKTRITAKKT
jgi:hypothetical protein